MQERCAQGLYFNCNDKFCPGHVCRSKQFLLLLADDIESPELPDLPGFLPVAPEEPPPPPLRFLSIEVASDSVHFQLSSAAVSGSIFPHTLCLRGLVHEHSISVLIDSGSSHNIVQPCVPEFLGLPIMPFSAFSVLVGNGVALHCAGVCHEVPLVLQSHQLSILLFIIPIYGADIVLRVQWLSTLGPFVLDFSIPSMQFYHKDCLVTLTSEPSSTPHYASFSQLRRYVTTNSIESCCLFSVHASAITTPSLSPSTSVIPPNLYPLDLHSILSTFNHLFSVPKGLPPPHPQTVKPPYTFNSKPATSQHQTASIPPLPKGNYGAVDL
ncbi:UNVERIFIED_CONTAM: hypothetical protein Sradi_0707700 [Sesamum radiatum]|uniref:Uncharacterized protein n=1 Tax=Sesamum radiatum TaxID=300843 RepID=A0AAW2VRR7_SESRA